MSLPRTLRAGAFLRVLPLTLALISGTGLLTSSLGCSSSSSSADRVVAPAILTQPANTTVVAGSPASFAVATSGTAPLTYQWSKGSTALTGATASIYSIAATSAADAGSYAVTVSNSAGTVTSSAASLTVSPAPIAPAILTQPSSATVIAGSATGFSVVVSGTSPFTFQWKLNGAVVGSNSASYTIAAAQASDAGSYTVTVSNAVGSVTSSAATLTVNPLIIAPAITTQPASVTVNEGLPASFKVVATGTAPFTYQWKKGTTVVGTNSDTFAIAATAAADAGSYTVTVSNSASSVTSAAAVLTVNSAPAITTQPASVAVTAGQPASFKVVASGTAPLTYQWKKGTTVVGTNSDTFAIAATTAADAGSYTVTVSNVVSSVTSAAAVLTLNSAPAITTQPASVTVTAGQPASFKVVATGTAPLTYQWKKGTTVVGTNSDTFAIAATAAADAGSYTVTVSNVVTSVTSAAATLTVNPLVVPITITTQPAAANPIIPDVASFSVVVANTTAATTYQWMKDAVAIPGATLSSYTTGPTSLQAGERSASYTVVVKDGATTLTSNVAKLSAIAPNPTYPAGGDPVGDTARNLKVLPSHTVDAVFFPNGAFRLGYDEALKNPVWGAYASFRTTASTFPSPTRTFASDDRLTTPRVADGDMGIHGGAGFYLTNLTGFDRGHMVPYAELGSRYGITTATFDDTCLMSNVVAQVSNFNQGVWQNLEDAFNGFTTAPSSFTRIWIYTGSVFQAPTNYWVPSTESYTTTPNTLATGTLAIAIPVANYKIAVAEPAAGQTLPQVIAWVGANRFYASSENSDHWKYVTSVARVEALTGLKFFPNLEADPNFAAIKTSVDVRPWGSVLGKSAGPNVHILQPSWDIKPSGTDVVSANPNAPEYVLQPTVTQGDTVTFVAAASTTATGSIPNAFWTFGDSINTVPVSFVVTKGVATPDTKTHTYTTAGTFTATFTATDGLGASNSITRVITVAPAAAANQPPYTVPATLPGVSVSMAPAGTAATQVFTVGDDTTLPLSAITVTATSDNQAVLANGSIVATFSAPATWTLSMTPAAAGTANVTVVLKDKDNASTSKTFLFTATPAAIGGTPMLIISQYYEGTSNNKWIEITNVGTGDFDAAVTPMYLWNWANPYSATTNYGANAITGTIAVGASKLYMNSASVLPLAANITGTGIAGSAVNFNGDDVPFLSPTAPNPATGTITNGAAAYAARTDVIGVNDSVLWMGNTGTTGNTVYAKALGCNRSYVRNANIKTASPTFNISDWTQVDPVEITSAAPSAVDTAPATSTNRLGFHVYIP
jgi:DNA/RNA endonuclease G (NUC1)